MNNFGFVSLSIHPTYPEDAGTYTCLLRNSLGESSANAQLSTVSTEPLQLDPLHAEALPTIQSIEEYQVHWHYLNCVYLYCRCTLAQCLWKDRKSFKVLNSRNLCDLLVAKLKLTWSSRFILNVEYSQPMMLECQWNGCSMDCHWQQHIASGQCLILAMLRWISSTRILKIAVLILVLPGMN